MDQSGHHAAGPGARVHRAVFHDARVDTSHFFHDVVELDGGTQRAFLLQQAVYGGVAQDALGVAQGAHHQARVEFGGSHNGLLDVGMHGRLLGGNKARTHVDALGAQAQGGCQRAAIGHTARCDKWNLEFIGGAGQQDEVGHIVLARVATALKPVHADRIAANGFSLERMAHRGAFVNDLDAGFVQRGQVFLRVVSGSLHRLDAAVDDGLDVARVIGRADGGQKGEVHAKGLVGHLAAAADLVGQVLRGALGQAGNHAQTACVGDGGGQFGKPHKMHTPLNDGVLNAKQFGDFGLHGRWFLSRQLWVAA